MCCRCLRRSSETRKTYRLPCYALEDRVDILQSGIEFLRVKKMSGYDGNEDSQCERTTEREATAMGDVLAKEHTEDILCGGLDAPVDPPLRDQRQEADGAADTDHDAPSPSANDFLVSALCLTIDQIVQSEALRIEDDHQNDELSSGRVNSTSLTNGCLDLALNPGSPPRHTKANCSCDTCKVKREKFKLELEEALRLQSLWLQLRQYILNVFNTAVETARTPASPRLQSDNPCTALMHSAVIQLCKMDSQQLFMRLVGQVQEFLLDVKVHLLGLLHDHHIDNLAEVFLIGLSDGYDALISATSKISPLVEPLEKEYLCKFNLTWKCLNKKLYQNYVYTDSRVQDNLQPFIGQLRKSLPHRGAEYQKLVYKYLAFDDEMTRIGDSWPETELLIEKYNGEQAERMTSVRKFREGWEMFTARRKLMQQRMWTKPTENENELREFDGQLLSLVTRGITGTPNSDSRPSSPNSELSLDTPSISISNDAMQLAHIVESLTDTEFQRRTNGAKFPLTGVFLESFKFGYEYKRKAILAERAIKSTSPINNERVDGEGSENGCTESEDERCECHARSLEVEQQQSEDVRNGVPEDTDLRKNEPQPCPCVYQHAKELAEQKKDIVDNPPCPCLRKTKKKTVATTIPSIPVKTSPEAKKPIVKTGSTQSAQTQTRHSTTQTPNTNHNHNHTMHQGSTHAHSHGPLPDLMKNTGTAHRGHTQNNHTPHACHKQANIEHIKRVSCNDLSTADGDCSDSGSSQEDSCSTSSSTPRDSSRHCDCCYCEVFGHGVPSVAPVSRNYNEMRERLRQLLTKKKAKKCKAASSPPKSPVESIPVNPTVHPKPASSHSAARSNTPVSTTSTVHQEQRDQRDLETLLEFIEGNQNGKRDNKKAEKKARQKQRKLEEKLKGDRQEAERQKLIELQKKTPEVTITVVDPQKPVPQRLLPQRTLPEVSILPASSPVVLTTLKQPTNNKKKDKPEVATGNSGTNSAKAKTMTINTNQKNKSAAATDRVDGIVHSSQTNKLSSKVDKADVGKGNNSKNTVTNNNVTSAKNSNSSVSLSSNTVDSDKKLTKKERKKLKRELKKNEEAKVKEQEKPSQAENQPQIVTIKRVMESNSAEPTVTITLKGQTPAEDKVLFTLVNGQTKEPNPMKPEQQQGQNSNSGKKKKTKGGANQQQQLTKSQQQQTQSNVLKQQQTNTIDAKSAKQQSINDKLKNAKQAEDNKKSQQQSTNDTRSTKSKKDKKNAENREPISQQNTQNKGKHQQQTGNNKKQNKVSTPPQTLTTQKHQQSSTTSDANVKKTKGQQQQEKNSQSNTGKTVKNNNNNNNSNNNANKSTKNDHQKNQIKSNQCIPKQKSSTEIQNTATERFDSPLSSQFKDIGTNSKINIENLKLPPGITITKVDAPAKPLPIRSAPMPKPVSPPKQTTIIAAPMSGVQSSYAGPQSGGNVIVVDTGKLKQDLIPKTSDKESPKEYQQPQSVNGKKKKKKGKNASGASSMNVSITPTNNQPSGGSVSKDHTDEPARILHNPGTNMVTIRNPAFGPPKAEPTQQAAIIKVSENGMVTIRSPALQQAINAGLTPPPKPDFIVKGDLSSSNVSNGRTNLMPTNSARQTNSIIPSSLAELRSRLTPDCTGLTGLANIQISKVTNGQPIPENGINLKGTSVTLTKVRSEAVMDDVQQAKTAVREAISATMAASGSGKGKKKKKKGNGTRQSGDDWNLVESVFTPKDIDLEDGEMDDAERELEAFKRFCLQSVPPARKEKVNLNIKDIVLKKKSSAAVIAAN
ncbi:uncharacterized protein LOC107271664 isoform X2 [Cephus cinctus]|uniref:Uncharacterized protein LOC107271664 isoform X2 n=1 Tax=Cephus cinctus TaxID=211228 RepID=A0AAJ7C6Y6_CEPCN|nr:uncharacterized protein LOC107271664 isoform X2 [Cephus cinctus]